MSAGNPSAPTRRGARLALIRARTGINPVMVPFVAFAGLAYAYFAQAAELIGQSGTTVAILTVLAVLCVAGMLLRPTADRLELFRVFSFYYLMAFCVGPLFEPAISLYVLDDPRPVLLERSSALALLAYVMMAIGYHLPLYRRTPKMVLARHDEYNVPLATGLGLGLFVVGVVSFLALFVLAGGAAVILRGEGGVHRTEFAFGGLGPVYYASLWMVSGAAIYFSSRASRKRPFAWIQAWPHVTAFALLLLLQGRHRAMGPIMVMFAISHYLIRRIRLPRLAVYGTVGVALAIVMGIARAPDMRGSFVADPVGFSKLVLRDFPERAEDLLAGDIGRLDEVMIVVDHVPDRMPYDWGWSLTVPLNPFRRMFMGPGREAPMIGERLYIISRPDARTAVYRTGFLPSVVGEMRANFPWFFCVIPYTLYGMALRFVYQRLVVTSADFLSVAAYSIIGLFLCNGIIGAIGQSLFELVLVAAPVLAIRAVVRRRGRRRVELQAPVQPVATPPA